MRELRFAHQAEQDMAAILTYSIEHWGPAKAAQ